MPDFYKPARDFLSERYTLKIDLGIEDTDRLRFYLELTNKTRDVPLIVHEVRIHYGSTKYSHYFRLSPFEDVVITPKARSRFTLGYEPFETIVGRRYQTTKPPEESLNGGSDGPS